jgi:CheY-like chemotaxis protein
MQYLMNRFAHTWTARRARSDEQKLRLLLVDDNRNGVEALAAMMSFHDADCRIALGGREAITVAADWLPQVIVMDISMPECNGLQAALAIRANPRTAETVIIAFTALDENDVRQRLVNDEIDAYCQKGHATTHLMRLIETLTI